MQRIFCLQAPNFFEMKISFHSLERSFLKKKLRTRVILKSIKNFVTLSQKSHICIHYLWYLRIYTGYQLENEMSPVSGVCSGVWEKYLDTSILFSNGQIFLHTFNLLAGVNVALEILNIKSSQVTPFFKWHETLLVPYLFYLRSVVSEKSCFKSA